MILMLPTLLYHLLGAVVMLHPEKEYHWSGPLILCDVFFKGVNQNPFI